MIASVLEGILGFLLESIFRLLWWAILYPVLLVVALPVILTLSLFQREYYSESVAENFTALHCFWQKWGFAILC
ncbi:MAG: hypothetical protein ABI615_04840 [Chthoniobacterales bacterium]